MNDLEATRLCAVAMGFGSVKIGSDRGPDKEPSNTVWVAGFPNADHSIYSPISGLLSGEAAMALVKRFRVTCEPEKEYWTCWPDNSQTVTHNADLNRAIVYCVAAMQAAAPPKRRDPEGR